MKTTGGGCDRSVGGIDTLVGAGMRVSGDIASNGIVCVQGCVEGNVHCEGSPGATLIVDGSGAVTGNVRVANLVVRGKIDGTVDAANTIELQETARVAGDVTFRNMSIAPGAVVEGVMIPRAATPAIESTVEPTGRPAKTPANVSAPGLAGIAERRLKPIHLVFGGAALLSVVGAYLMRGTPSPPPPLPQETLQSEKPAPASLKPAVALAPPATPAPPSIPPPEASTQNVSANKPVPPGETTPTAETENDSGPAVADDVVAAEPNVVTVRGANPARPANVLLLVSEEPSVFYRRKRGESGDGARVHIGAGKVSVNIGPDDLIRLEKDSDVIIYFQGQKVPPHRVQEKWVRFVRRQR